MRPARGENGLARLRSAPRRVFQHPAGPSNSWQMRIVSTCRRESNSDPIGPSMGQPGFQARSISDGRSAEVCWNHRCV
jgi:hypothetical protein